MPVTRKTRPMEPAAVDAIMWALAALASEYQKAQPIQPAMRRDFKRRLREMAVEILSYE